MPGYFDLLSTMMGSQVAAIPEDEDGIFDDDGVKWVPSTDPSKIEKVKNSPEVAQARENLKKAGFGANLVREAIPMAPEYAVSAPAKKDESGNWVPDDNSETRLQKFGRNLSGGLMSAGSTLSGVSPGPQQAPPKQDKKENKPTITSKYGNGFSGGQTQGQGATSTWGVPDAPAVPVVLPQVPNFNLSNPPQVQSFPQISDPPPNLQLTMPQYKSQYQLGDPQMYYSDKNLKTNISNTSKSDIKSFMGSISKPQNYDYKDSNNGSHTKGGLMAQDLEKSNIGKSVVINTPKGKAVDTAKLATIVASIHSHKINELEMKLENALNKKFKKGTK